MKAGVVIARKAMMPPPGVLGAQSGRGDILPFMSDRLFFTATDAGNFSGFLMLQPVSPVCLLWPQRSKSVKSVGAFESSLHTAFGNSILLLKQQTCPQLWIVCTFPLPLACFTTPAWPTPAGLPPGWRSPWIHWQMTDVNCKNYHFIQTLAAYSLIFLLSELCGHGLALIIPAVFYHPHEREDYYHFKPYNLMLLPLPLHRFC